MGSPMICLQAKNDTHGDTVIIGSIREGAHVSGYHWIIRLSSMREKVGRQNSLSTNATNIFSRLVISELGYYLSP